MAAFGSRRINRLPPYGIGLAYGNPLTRDLTFACHFADLKPIDVAGNRAGTMIGSGQATKDTRWAIGYNDPGTSSCWFERDAGLEPSGSLTYGLLTVHNAAFATSFQRPMGKTYNNGGSSPFLSYDFETQGVSVDTFNANINIGGTLKSTGNLSVTQNALNVVLARFDSAAQLFQLYCNGTYGTAIATGGSSVSYDTTSTGRFIVCGASSAAASGVPTNETVLLVVVWARALDNREIASFTDNPWQIFARRTRRIWLGPPAAAGSVFNPISGRGGSVAQPLVIH